jgi:hypothetical protein
MPQCRSAIHGRSDQEEKHFVADIEVKLAHGFHPILRML